MGDKEKPFDRVDMETKEANANGGASRGGRSWSASLSIDDAIHVQVGEVVLQGAGLHPTLFYVVTLIRNSKGPSH